MTANCFRRHSAYLEGCSVGAAYRCRFGDRLLGPDLLLGRRLRAPRLSEEYAVMIPLPAIKELNQLETNSGQFGDHDIPRNAVTLAVCRDALDGKEEREPKAAGKVDHCQPSSGTK